MHMSQVQFPSLFEHHAQLFLRRGKVKIQYISSWVSLTLLIVVRVQKAVHWVLSWQAHMDVIPLHVCIRNPSCDLGCKNCSFGIAHLPLPSILYSSVNNCQYLLNQAWGLHYSGCRVNHSALVLRIGKQRMLSPGLLPEHNRENSGRMMDAPPDISK